MQRLTDFVWKVLEKMTDITAGVMCPRSTVWNVKEPVYHCKMRLSVKDEQHPSA